MNSLFHQNCVIQPFSSVIRPSCPLGRVPRAKGTTGNFDEEFVIRIWVFEGVEVLRKPGTRFG